MFEIIKLKNLGIELIDGDRGKNYPHQNELMDNGYCLFLSAKNVTTNGFDFEEKQFISKDKDRILRNGKLVRGDIVVTTRGTVGNVALYDESVSYENVRINSGMLIVRCDSRICKEYLYYVLRSEWFHTKIKAIQTGSAQPQLPKSHFEKMDIPVPSVDIQIRIADVIMQFDKKIACNSMINRNLSEQMQAIFASIFYPEIEAGNKVSLGDYLYIKGRIGWKGLKKDEYLDESEYRIINGESLTATGIDWAKAGYISEERYIESPEIMLQEGDILISKDGTIGKIGYVNRLEKPTSVASGIFVVRNLKPEEVSTVFIFCLLNSDYFKGFIASRTEGSVIPHLYQKDFVTLEIPLLTQEQLNIFNGSVNPLFELYFKNQTENIQLTALRDTLLPRLMSGELDVSDIDI